MPFEVELKAWVANPVELEAKLRGQAAFEGEAHLADVYFKPKHTSGHVRLRNDGSNFLVTTKFKQISDGIEVNDEVEFGVSDGGAFCRMLHRFGFEPYIVKRKHSKVYRADDVRFDLVEVEQLGTFIEIEIMCEAQSEVAAARQRLLDWLMRLEIEQDTVEGTPYTQLLREQGTLRYELDLTNSELFVREISVDEAGQQNRLF